MATLGAGMLTLADVAKLKDPEGKIALVGELLNQTNQVLDDVPWIEGNMDSGHQFSQRTGLPTVAWRLANTGVAPSKSTAAQVTDTCGILEAWSEVDQVVADRGGDPAGVRFSEAKPFMEAMVEEFVGTLFYGNTSTAPEEFKGFAPRYDDVTGSIADNVIDAGGTGSDNSSIWLVGWSPETIFGIYPRGTMAGLSHKDLGLQVVESTAGIAGNRLLAYRDQWQWQCGLAVKDWRYAVRICNIDISNLTGKSSAADLFDRMIQATHAVPNITGARFAFYANRTCFQMLDIQARDDVQSGGQLTYDVVGGKRMASFRGIPVRLCDQLTETEARVT